MQLGSVPAAAGGFLLEQAGASGGTECGTLLRQVLPVAGDAAVAQHGAGGLLRRLGGETLTTSFGSMRKSLAGVQLPKSYQAMCCQYGSGTGSTGPRRSFAPKAMPYRLRSPWQRSSSRRTPPSLSAA